MEIEKVLVYIILLYTLVAFIVLATNNNGLKRIYRLIIPLAFFGTIVLFGSIAKLFDNDNITAIVNISGMFLADTLIIFFPIKLNKRK